MYGSWQTPSLEVVISTNLLYLSRPFLPIYSPKMLASDWYQLFFNDIIFLEHFQKEADSMIFKKQVAKEILVFLFIAGISFLAWYILANIADQQIISEQCLYDKEKNASIITVGAVYIIRIIAWAV